MSVVKRRPSKKEDVNGLLRLARMFKERAEGLDYVGKMRDDAALEYFSGAAAAALISGRAGLHDELARYAQYSVAPRGYIGVVELLLQADSRMIARPTKRAGSKIDDRAWRVSGGILRAGDE